jgi:uncharacterized protein involved in exopolysaccharide biosynthesis
MYNEALIARSSRPVPLSYVTAAMRRQRWLALSVFFFVVTAAGVITILMPKKYTAQMKVLVKNARPSRVVSPEPSGAEASPSDVGESQINSEIELMNTNELLSKVVRNCNLAKAGSDGLAVEKAVVKLARNLKIAPVRKANIIQVEYTSTDPRIAVAVLRQLSSLYLDAHLRLHGSPGTHQFFQEQATRYGNELRNVESELLLFRTQNSIIATGEQRDLLLRSSSEAEAGLLGVDAEISELQQKVGKTGQKMLSVLPRVLTVKRSMPNQYSIERLGTILVELQNRRTDLLTKFQPSDRLVQEVDRQIADTSKALEQSTIGNSEEQSSDVNPLHQSLEAEHTNQEIELAGLKARRSVLAAQVNDYHHKLAGLVVATDTEETLMRNRKEAESNYLLYARKQEEARVADLLDQQKIANVAIAEPPTEPHIPSQPSVTVNLALGLFLGIVVSLGTAIGTEYYTGGVYSSAELEMYTGLPVLSFVPTEAE